MTQLLEVAFSLFNNWDQAEEEERAQHEKRQARDQAKLMGRFWRLPLRCPISIKELWVVQDVAGRKIGLLMDVGATYPVLNSHTGPLSSKAAQGLVSMESLPPVTSLASPWTTSTLSALTCFSGCPQVS